MATDEDVRAMFDSNYVSAVDLMGKDVIVKITKVVASEIPKAGTSKKDRLPVIFFEGKDKGLCLNKTNLKTIAAIVGSFKVKDWIGQVIAIYPTTCQFGPNTVDCIRVRPQAPREKAAA